MTTLLIILFIADTEVDLMDELLDTAENFDELNCAETSEDKNGISLKNIYFLLIEYVFIIFSEKKEEKH